ncbi:hypothetical protein A3850_011600 [Lewinella sp. 4G2]|nr:hypothetical protein A3850_011600 [Lewinella sp. 4G2]
MALPELISNDFTDFKDWIIEIRELEERNDAFVSNGTYQLMLQSDLHFSIDGIISQEIYDEVVYNYITGYCDYGPGKGNLALIGPMLKAAKFDTLIKEARALKFDTLTTLITLIEEGRSYLTGRPFSRSSFIESAIGFWYPSEQLILKLQLENSMSKLSTKSQELATELIAMIIEETHASEIIIDYELI